MNDDATFFGLNFRYNIIILDLLLNMSALHTLSTLVRITSLR